MSLNQIFNSIYNNVLSLTTSWAEHVEELGPLLAFAVYKPVSDSLKSYKIVIVFLTSNFTEYRAFGCG